MPQTDIKKLRAPVWYALSQTAAAAGLSLHNLQQSASAIFSQPSHSSPRWRATWV